MRASIGQGVAGILARAAARPWLMHRLLGKGTRLTPPPGAIGRLGFGLTHRGLAERSVGEHAQGPAIAVEQGIARVAGGLLHLPLADDLAQDRRVEPGVFGLAVDLLDVLVQRFALVV
jgi:hypothetical protein